MHDDTKTPTPCLAGDSLGKRSDSAESTQQRKRTFVKRNLGRARRDEYQKIYREAYIVSHGGGKAGREALRERNRQRKRSSRGVRYLPLLFETADHRYRVWTWDGPSKLILRSVQEADGMRELFVPRLRPRVIAYTTDVNHDLRSACKAAAAGIPFQALSDHERLAYAFLLWNECRRYEFLNAIHSDADPSAEDSTLRLVSELLVEALTQPVEFVRFLTGPIKAGLDEYMQELQAGECPLDEDDPCDAVSLRFHNTLAAAHAYLGASGLGTSATDRSTAYRRWFRRQIRVTERSEPSLRDLPDAIPFSTFADYAMLPDGRDVVRHDGGVPTAQNSARERGHRKRQRKSRTKHPSPRRTVKK